MKLLLLGGTRFLGRHFVKAAFARGHELTLFNRGQSNAALFASLEQLHGNRDGGLAALAADPARTWDAVVDLCGFLPRVVRASAELLRERVDHYVFISSVSVYEEPSATTSPSASPGIDEDSPLATLADAGTEEVMAHYGALKAACEAVVNEVFGARALIVRPGLIVGPYDPTGRFTYWPRRLAAGGEILAPGDPTLPVQFIDVRDLASWLVRLLEQKVGGTFNAVGPQAAITMREFLETIAAAVAPGARLAWVDEDFLLAHDVEPWMQLPLWLPANVAAVSRVSFERAGAAGLSLRSLKDTAQDTLDWSRSAEFVEPTGIYANVGLEREREQTLLTAWRVRSHKSRNREEK